MAHVQLPDDTISVASEPGAPLTIDSLSRKLGRTREQLKVAVERIISLEKREMDLVKRLDTLEIRINQIEGVGEEDDAKSNQSEDSIKGLLDLNYEEPKGVNLTLPKIPDTHDADSVLQGAVDRSGPPMFQATPNPATGAGSGELESQYGIRAGVLDTSKVIHFRFDGKDRDYLQWSAIIVSYLEGYGLWSYVSGERPRPPAPSDPDFQTYGTGEGNYAKW